VRRLYRRSDRRVIAGVCSGLARHLGVDPLIIRVAFILLALAGGAGVVMYGAFWVLAPLETPAGAANGGTDEPADVKREIGYLIALGALAIGALLLFQSVGFGLPAGVLWPLFVVGFGVMILWRQADESQRARLRAVTGSSRRVGLARALAGVLLVGAGMIAFFASGSNPGDAWSVLVATVVVVGGLALISGPWWLRLVRELGAERAARIREQERAEVAAHVHDSVLHTLTLIQRNVDDPREVARLARAQERELRTWLYRPVADPDSTLVAAVERLAADVEDAHGVAVEVVTVGDCDLDDRLRAMLQAAREALVNAAKYAGESPISLYAEVEPEQVAVYVRDRGPGFDLEAAPPDRLGIRQSIIGRMARHGGSATVRSNPAGDGEGTEIQLEIPRGAAP
jgi:signal transduction histidine kinase/phage shock protein PspC (stress-responsive transcriptional regulator)